MKHRSGRGQIQVIPLVVRTAHEHASMVRQQADDQARAIIAAAVAQAESIRAAAVADGMLAGREQVVASYTEIMRKASAVDHLSETALVALAIDVARAVLDREATADKQMIRDIARKALSRVRRAQTVVLHVHRDDEAEARRSIRDWLAPGAEPTILDVTVDPTVALGSVIVESDLGRIDATLDGQLAAIARALESDVG